MRPGKSLSRDLSSEDLVNLLVDSSVIVLHVRVDSGQDGVSSRLGSGDKVGGSGFLTKRKEVFPGLVVSVGIGKGKVATVLDLLLHFTCSVVEELSEGSG